MTPDAGHLWLEVPYDVVQAQQVRFAVAETFTCLGGALPAAKIVVAELVTNAVLHGAPPVHLAASASPDAVRFEVSDARPDLGPPSADSRGLMLIAELAERWGVDGADDGKVVWAEVRCDEVDPADPAVLR